MKSEWKKVTLGDLISVSQGYTFKPEFQGVQGEKWQYFKVADIGLSSNKKYLITALNSISEEIKQFLKIKEFPAGSIAFPRVGAALLNNNKKILFQDSIVDDNTIVITPHTATINNEFLYYWFLTKQLKDFCNDGPVPVISSKNIKSSKILLPPISEQEKIAKTLSIWDSAIEKTEKLIEKKEALLNWYAKRILISGKTSKVLFSDLFKLSSEKNTLNQSYPALSVTKDGVVFQEEYFNKRVASDDTRSYLIARRNTFVFSGLNFWMGSVDLQTLTDVGIISPAYKVFTINSDLISFEYAHFLIRSNYMKKLLMDSSIVGASIVRRNLDMDNLLNSAIELPELDQQAKIVEQLSLIQKDIGLNKKLLKQYKLQKQGLMQKLLTGEWRIE